MVIAPSAVVWALSALSIMMVVIAVYFAIFWMMIGTMFIGIASFLGKIFSVFVD